MIKELDLQKFFNIYYPHARARMTGGDKDKVVTITSCDAKIIGPMFGGVIPAVCYHEGEEENNDEVIAEELSSFLARFELIY